jgi:3-methylcrotonyl-CoA carboxylase alpha subunit
MRLPQRIRVDTGVEQGDAVTPFYDPMIAKLIVHAPSRRAAAAQLSAACASVEVWPVKTNAAFLARAAAHREFVAGHVDTAFIEKHQSELVPAHDVSLPVLQAAAAARVAVFRDASVWGAGTGLRMNAEPQLQIEVQSGQLRKLVDLRQARATLRSTTLGTDTLVFERGQVFVFNEPQSLTAAGGSAADGAIRAPMPGKIIAIQVKAGAEVHKGQALITVEAMKMEHTLTAPFDGSVGDIAHTVGQQVSEGTALLHITRKDA